MKCVRYVGLLLCFFSLVGCSNYELGEGWSTRTISSQISITTEDGVAFRIELQDSDLVQLFADFVRLIYHYGDEKHAMGVGTGFVDHSLSQAFSTQDFPTTFPDFGEGSDISLFELTTSSPTHHTEMQKFELGYRDGYRINPIGGQFILQFRANPKISPSPGDTVVLRVPSHLGNVIREDYQKCLDGLVFDGQGQVFTSCDNILELSNYSERKELYLGTAEIE